MRFGRILLKLSGEMLAGSTGVGFDSDAMGFVASEVSGAMQLGVQIAIVVGAGNVVRGAGPNASPLRVRRQPLDTMGMLATAINGTALTDTFRSKGLPAVHMTTMPALPFSKPFDADEAVDLLSRDTILVLSGGTGLPFFSTDTAAAVRALQVSADALVKGTQVDGVYDRDPRGTGAVPATHIPSISHKRLLEQGLQILDPPATALCAQHKLPILVYNAHCSGNLVKLLRGELLSSTIES